MQNKKNKIFITFGLLIILLAVLFFCVSSGYLSKGFAKQVVIDGHVFSVQMVTSETDMQKGLGGQESICKKCGMLFQFSSPGEYDFWMKNMRFPLDIIWISQGKIVHLEKNVQPSFAGILTPKTSADQVVEINAGNVDLFGIKIGDSVSS